MRAFFEGIRFHFFILRRGDVDAVDGRIVSVLIIDKQILEYQFVFDYIFTIVTTPARRAAGMRFQTVKPGEKGIGAEAVTSLKSLPW